MEKINLGLPLEYQERPEYFDAHNTDDSTDAKNGVIESLLKTHKVQTVLDLTCGTGSQVFFLDKRGYQVTGADFSPALLDIARERASNEKIDVKFIDGDMRTLRVGTFDAVITIFNAVGHLTKTDFERAMKNIHANLKDGGIYVFDIFNLEAMTDSAVSDLAMDVHRSVNDTQIHNMQYSEINRENGILTSYDSYTINKKAEKPEKLNHKFSLQIYNCQELKEMLARNGFETLDQYGMDRSKFLAQETTNILTVARRI